jgi:energy-coupling factor transport system permease protein
MIMIISMLLLFISFNVLLNSQRFLYLFSRILPQASFIVNMALGYVSLLIIRAKELISVLSLRGIDIKTGKKTDILKNATQIFTALTQWSLEDGMCVAQTLKARGYAKQRRTIYQSFTFTLKDKVCLLFCRISYDFGILFTYGAGIQLLSKLDTLRFEPKDIVAYI